MKAHFVGAHPILLGPRENKKHVDLMHEHVIWDAWQKQASLRYKDLTYEVRVDRGENGRGLYTVRLVCPTASVEGTMSRYTIQRVSGEAKHQEPKANAKNLHIDTHLLIPIDEQLMFEAVGGSNKGHVYGFGSHLQQSLQSTVEAATTRHRFLRYL
ncbi:hypothetical protein M9H77_08026 [Catharanthus roseus]|uniref:Uncharacterized protein n=1 Tax=Catharanthus roseus TaxID=4058 RepID=A0ACC0BWR8_CATRO|nr:hypothetical protein M9H77_08026 [Catharanthus roseus]